jgi:predicted component of type VI protein secretion system
MSVAQLFALSGSDLGRSFRVEPGARIGRSPDCAVALKDASISRHHAHLEFDQGVWSVVDDDSTNGLYLTGRRVGRAVLADKTEFKLGEVQMRIRVEVADLPEAAPVLQRTPPTPAVAPPARSPAPAIEDEIVLEEAPQSSAPRPLASAPVASIRVRASTAPELAPLAATAARPAPGLQQVGSRVLQYHQTRAHGGFLSADLEQYPGWVRALVWILALALFGALALGAFHLTGFFKQRVAGEALIEDVELEALEQR